MGYQSSKSVQESCEHTVQSACTWPGNNACCTWLRECCRQEEFSPNHIKALFSIPGKNEIVWDVTAATVLGLSCGFVTCEQRGERERGTNKWDFRQKSKSMHFIVMCGIALTQLQTSVLEYFATAQISLGSSKQLNQPLQPWKLQNHQCNDDIYPALSEPDYAWHGRKAPPTLLTELFMQQQLIPRREGHSSAERILVIRELWIEIFWLPLKREIVNQKYLLQNLVPIDEMFMAHMNRNSWYTKPQDPRQKQ